MRITSLAAAMTILAVQGCGPEGTAPQAGESARVRLASASPDAGALDLLVNGKTVARGISHSRASAVTQVAAGQARGEIRATGAPEALASLSLTLVAGESYTVLVAGPLQALTAVVSVDTGSSGPPALSPSPGEPVDSGNAPPPLPDAARFRILHAAPHAPPLDVYLTPAGSALDTLPAFEPFAYGSLALIGDLVRAPGRYTVQFTEDGTTRVLLDTGDLTASAGELLTVVLGENADQSLRADVLRE